MAYKATTTRQSKPRSGIALGGIGAGWFELRQDGQFYDWNIFNNKPLYLGAPFAMDHDSLLFFVIRFQVKGEQPRLRLLQIENKLGAAAIRGHEHYYIFPWLSGVDQIDFHATFPFAHLTYTDRDMPLAVELEAYTPFIPHDVKNSSLPAAIFTFNVTSQCDKPVDVLLMACMRNAVGYDVEDKLYDHKVVDGKGYRTIEMTCKRLPRKHTSAGSMGLTSLSGASTYYLGWEHHHPYYEIVLRNRKLPNLDDTQGRNPKNKTTDKSQAMSHAYSTIAMSRKLNQSGHTLKHTFAATWHFPNAYAQDPGPSTRGNCRAAEHIEGHYYDNFFKSSSDVAAYVADHHETLYEKTRHFREAFYDSSLDEFVLDQVNSNLNTFFTSSWLTKAGHFGIIEGLNAYQSYAGLATTDVAMYGSVSYASLFPELAMDVIRTYQKFQHQRGSVAHSIPRNFRDIGDRESNPKRLDMPAQYAFMALRAFFWSSDRKYLKEIWPSVTKALDYVLRERDMNNDLLPDMEGVMCSYDNFPMYGVASYVAGQWLAAVRAAMEAARILGDNKTLAAYGRVFERGCATFEQKLWNGKYYRLSNDLEGPHGEKDEGCLTDQLIGQWAAHQIGMGHIFSEARVKKALDHVMKSNYVPEYGLRNCQWPCDQYFHDVSETTWVDQANTCWTGVELGFASFLIYEGLLEHGLEVIRNVDERYRHWGIYWDHQEFGGHYFRPMSAWAIIHAALGLSICDQVYTFAPKIPGDDIKLFFAFHGGYGHYIRQIEEDGARIILRALSGALTLRKMITTIDDPEKVTCLTIAGVEVEEEDYDAQATDHGIEIEFDPAVVIDDGQALEIVIC